MGSMNKHKLSNTQLLLMVEHIMVACEDRVSWDETTKDVWMAMHMAWTTLSSDESVRTALKQDSSNKVNA